MMIANVYTFEQVSAASVFGQMGSAGVSPYCASKAAVIGLSRTAAKENKDIRVNCVSPGKKSTPAGRNEITNFDY